MIGDPTLAFFGEVVDDELLSVGARVAMLENKGILFRNGAEVVIERIEFSSIGTWKAGKTEQRDLRLMRAHEESNLR